MTYFLAAVSGSNVLRSGSENVDELRTNKAQKLREPVLIFVCRKRHKDAKAVVRSPVFVSLWKREQ
jgi:hypothetical protein